MAVLTEMQSPSATRVPATGAPGAVDAHRVLATLKTFREIHISVLAVSSGGAGSATEQVLLFLGMA